MRTEEVVRTSLNQTAVTEFSLLISELPEHVNFVVGGALTTATPVHGESPQPPSSRMGDKSWVTSVRGCCNPLCGGHLCKVY